MGGTQDSRVRRGVGSTEFQLPFVPLPDNIYSPINILQLEVFLQRYPNIEVAQYVLNGFREGFDVGFQGEISNTRPRNAQSVFTNSKGVFTAIAKELQCGHTSGPFHQPPFDVTHVSPIGAVPKPDGSIRLILDLSSPRGSSVNEGINPNEFACTYSRFDDAVHMVRYLGPRAFLAKLDIKHAFRLCPVRRDQWPLLTYKWGGNYFVDTRLPFGCRSSPFIFNRFADLLCWIFIMYGGVAFLIHYLDDFFFTNYSRESCQRDLDHMVQLCELLGVPLAPDKIIGPVQLLVYLGIEIDTVGMTTRLPGDKLEKILALVATFQGRKKVTKRELLSLIGLLSFASKVVKPGRMFLRRLIDLSITVSSLNFYITLNAEARADLAWWHDFLRQWNGVAIIHQPPKSSNDLRLYTDASDLGFGCVFGQQWAYDGWHEGWGLTSINAREAFAIWVAVRLWGDMWCNTHVVIYTDSEVNTLVWKTGTCRDRDIMRVIRTMFMFAAIRNINITLRHIPGTTNILADYLSRLQVMEFRRAFPTAADHPELIPHDVWSI